MLTRSRIDIHVVEPNQSGRRIDVFLSEVTGTSRSQIQNAIREGRVTVNDDALTRCSHSVQESDVIRLDVPEPKPLELEPSDVSLDIMFEDDHLVVVNKPAGMTVHPGPGHDRDTMVNALLGQVSFLSGIGGVLRPGIVHRLDKDTSGVLVVAKTDEAHVGLSAQFAKHTVERLYKALVIQLRGPGLSTETDTIDTLIGRHPNDRKRFSAAVTNGRRAVTHYRVCERFVDGAFGIELTLETGRTHQIRVHMAEIGCPVLGDAIYGGQVSARNRLIDRQALHAQILGFEHPVTGQTLRFEGEIPDDYRRAEKTLREGGTWRR